MADDRHRTPPKPPPRPPVDAMALVRQWDQARRAGDRANAYRFLHELEELARRPARK